MGKSCQEPTEAVFIVSRKLAHSEWTVDGFVLTHLFFLGSALSGEVAKGYFPYSEVIITSETVARCEVI